MRPRPEGRGEPISVSESFVRLGVLQCGHDPKAVENVTVAEVLGGLPDASMRPRPEGRGEQHSHRARGGGRRVASMRPRPEGRGERPGNRSPPSAGRCFNAATTRRPWRTWSTGSLGRHRRRLQCGHDPKAVENRVAGLHAGDRFHELQCGHDPKAVENESSHSRQRKQQARFNAATTRRPWRTPADNGNDCPDPAQASMRPRPEGRGERPTLTPVRAVQLASMRPRPEGRGEPRRSASATRLRGGASMRPRPEGRGEPSVCHGITPCPSGASMRPRPEGRGEHH